MDILGYMRQQKDMLGYMMSQKAIRGIRGNRWIY